LHIGTFIASRLSGRHQQSLSGLVVRLSLLATVFSVSVMILTLAFVSGFQEAIAKKVFSFSGHIRVQQHPPQSSDLSDESPSIANDSISDMIRRTGHVERVDAYINKTCLMRSPSSMEGIMLKGVEKDFTKNRFASFIIRGEGMSFDTTRPSVLISSHTARALGLDTGQQVFLYFMNERSEQPRVRKVRIAGIFKTAIEEYDRNFAITEIDFLQKMQQWENSAVSGYEVSIDDHINDTETVSRILDNVPVDWYATSIKEIYPNIFDWLNLQDTNRGLIIGIMCLVAIINLVSCLLILVLERRSMIGVLKAFGASDFQVQDIFWRQGMLIALKGIFWGNIVGLLLCWLQSSFGIIRLDEAAYYIREAPVKVIVWHLVAVNAGTILICLAILLIPSLLVRKINPVQALRFN
jgi:lipoprotein-releasing system permease protein